MEQLFSQWGPASALFGVRLLWAIAVFVLVLLLAGYGRRAAKQRLIRARTHPNVILLVERIAQFSILLFGSVFILAILGIDWSALAAGLGLVTVALTLSFQDILRALIAGIFLLVERPFEIGDLVEVGGTQGVIEDVGLRTTLLRSDKGERIIVPNLIIFTSIVIHKNRTKELV